MNPEMCVAGIGACTAIGADLWATAAAVRAGLAAFAEHPYMVDKAGEPMIVARAPYLEVDTPLATRMALLGARAARHAADQAFDGSRGDSQIPVLVGIPYEIPHLPEALAEHVFDAIGNPNARSMETVSAGHSAALLALQIAIERVRSGAAESYFVGGVDSYMDPDRLEELDKTDQLHSPSNSWGFIPGEGAAFCLITTVQNAHRRGIRPLCRIASVERSDEVNRIRTGSVCIGLGLSAAVRQALAALPSSDRVDMTLCDMNGDAYRADEYGFTIARMSECFHDATEVTTPADSWGDVGAASGVLFLALVVAAASKGYATGPYALLWTSSDTGERAAALVHSEVETESSNSWA